MARARSMETLTATLLVALMALAASAAESPREVTVRGMRMIAEEGADEQRQYDGWQLVARGIGDMLLAEGLWDAEDMRVKVGGFIRACADDAEFPEWSMPEEYVKEQTEFAFPIIIREPELLKARDADDALVGLQVCFTHHYGWGPTLRRWIKIVVARNGDRMVTGAWQQYVGRSPRDPPIQGMTWDGWHAWRAGGRVRAAFAGGWLYGGSGGPAFPVGILVESTGDHWRVLDFAGPDPPSRDHESERDPDSFDWRFHKGRARLDDLDGDGVPEITAGYEGPKVHVRENVTAYLQRDYFVYKIIGDRLRKVWYAKRATPRMAVLRYVDAIQYGCPQMARNVCASPAAFEAGQRLGLLDLVPDEFGNLMDCWGLGYEEADSYLTVGLKGQIYRFDVMQVGPQSWRISDIARVGPAASGR